MGTRRNPSGGSAPHPPMGSDADAAVVRRRGSARPQTPERSRRDRRTPRRRERRTPDRTGRESTLAGQAPEVRNKMPNRTIAWVPVLAPLLSIVADQESPDLVLNDLMAVGFNFQLPPELEGVGEPRKRAYLVEVQRWIDELDWTTQWELARALTRRLTENRDALVQQRLLGVGGRLDGIQFVPLEKGDVDQHVFFPAGAVHDAFVHIRSLFKGAMKEIFIIDGYVDSSIFEFLLSTNSPRACRILTKSQQLPKDFLAETKAFVAQHGFAFSIRSSDA